MASEGLSSREALTILIEECEGVVEEFKKSRGKSPSIQYTLSTSSNFCRLHHISLIISALLIAIGAVDLDNEISFPLLLVSFCLFLYTLISIVFVCKTHRQRENISLEKVRSIIHYLKNTKDNFGYNPFPEPLTEDMWGQFCIRNNHSVNVPKMLIVKGDILLLRPGQIAPCNCVDDKGAVIPAGSRIEMESQIDRRDGGYKRLMPKKAMCTQSIVISILKQCLERKTHSSNRRLLLHSWGERYFLLPYSLIVFMAVGIRYCYATSDSYYGRRFVFSIPALTILPLLLPTLPFILELLHYWNNKTVCDSLGITYDPSAKDFVELFARLTGTSVIDKKGILSSMNPCIDKVICMKINEESELVPETMGLSSEMVENGKWKLYFDDPLWEEHLPSLRPIGLNLQLNSCLHNQQYLTFLDHLSVISPNVPRTIATANRRCMCSFPQLLGFHNSSCLQFLQSEPKTLGFFKRQPGEAPYHGLTKHRTPLEMAFCTVHSDITSRHSHVSCQGTADVILDACTHVWNGYTVIPLSSRLSRQIRDIYQRNSMTGYCLLLSYRPLDKIISDDLFETFIEVPLAREGIFDEHVEIKSVSIDNIPQETEAPKTLKVAEELMDHVLSGQILTGVIAMQYEALPYAVKLAESLDRNCVRFVYFSRENELRSRVFAEKLGLEAGWNCHISLAEPMEEREQCNPLLDALVSNGEIWKKPGKLIKNCLSKSESYLIEEPADHNRKSPFRRMSSVHSTVGAMPNKAQLPTGVSRVRPHLEEVDNVPLLVGLFTDCDPEVNREMLTIMQENEEVVMIIGSSLNIYNTAMFLQSDVSVCVPPLLDPNCSFIHRQPGIPMAGDIAARILSTATDFELSHQQLLNISDTVTGCRHRDLAVRNALTFFILSSIQLSFLLLGSTIVTLPLIFNTGQIFLTIFLQLPLLFLAVVWTPFNPKYVVVKIAEKNEKFSIPSYLWTFGFRFFPTILFLLLLFFISLTENATLLCSYSDVTCYFGDEIKLNTEEIRHLVGFQFVVYLITNSLSWVHPLHILCWQPAIFSLPWILSSLSCIISQIIYSYSSGMYLHQIFNWLTLSIMGALMIIIAIVNEMVKFTFIRRFLREQRRTKLAFGTKLGMNSPY